MGDRWHRNNCIYSNLCHSTSLDDALLEEPLDVHYAAVLNQWYLTNGNKWQQMTKKRQTKMAKGYYVPMREKSSDTPINITVRGLETNEVFLKNLFLTV